MLILTRRVGETIVLGDDFVRITVLGVKGGQVRFGCTADKEISIHREEIWNKIQEQEKDEQK